MFFKVLCGSMFLLHIGHVTLTQASCYGYNAEKKRGEALVGHVIKTVNLNRFECSEMCFAMLNCFSINHYHNESDGRHMCEMNKASRRVIPGSFIYKPGYEYIEITKCNGDKCTDKSENSYTPIAHWKLDGSDKDVVLKGDAEYREDGSRNVLYLDGTDSWAETPAVDFRTTSFTLAYWVKILENASYGFIYGDWSAPYQFAFYFYYDTLYFVGNNANETAVWHVMASPLSVGLWIHVAASVNREAVRTEMFLNGKKVSSEPKSREEDAIDLMQNNHTVYDIGLQRDLGSNNTFKGFVRELVIFRRALQEDEVEAIKGAKSILTIIK